MNVRLLAVLVSALGLMMLSTASHGGGEVYCIGGDIEKQTQRAIGTVSTWDGQEREVCYEVEVKCENGLYFGYAQWSVLYAPPYITSKIPYFSWYAYNDAEDPSHEFCGMSGLEGWQLIVETNEWDTSCEFGNGENFKAKISEVEMVLCEADS